MSVYSDQRGITYTAANQDAVDHFDATITEYVHMGTETGARLKETLAADADFPMAHILRGCFMQLFCIPALTEKAKQSLAKARAASASVGVDDREQHHMGALGAWVAGDMRSALEHWESVLLDHPLDMLAVKLSQFTHFYLGDSRQLRDSIARILYAWHRSVPGHANVLGMYHSVTCAATTPSSRPAQALCPTKFTKLVPNKSSCAIHALLSPSLLR